MTQIYDKNNYDFSSHNFNFLSHYDLVFHNFENHALVNYNSDIKSKLQMYFYI